MIKKETTGRGFALGKFTDLYGAECSIQKSSLATDDAIWIGVDDANPIIMASIVREDLTGTVKYPIPEDVLLSTRMHLSEEMVVALIDKLQEWLKTGRL